MKPGQGLLFKMNFADGANSIYSRPFLVIKVKDDKVYLLNVSSLKGKVYKLNYPSNAAISNFKPPFIEPSFVKCDALYIVDKCKFLYNKLVHNGDTLNELDLKYIRSYFTKFKNTHRNQMHVVRYNERQLKAFNRPKNKLVAGGKSKY